MLFREEPRIVGLTDKLDGENVGGENHKRHSTQALTSIACATGCCSHSHLDLLAQANRLSSITKLLIPEGHIYMRMRTRIDSFIGAKKNSCRISRLVFKFMVIAVVLKAVVLLDCCQPPTYVFCIVN